MNDILVFQHVLEKHIPELLRFNYKMDSFADYNVAEEIYIWHNSTFYNEVLNKKLVFSFFPRSRNLTHCQITVVIVASNASSIDLSDFIAFKKKEALIDYADAQEHAFKIEIRNIKESIETQLQKIMDLLFSEFSPYFLRDEWINIPIKDPRDDY